jgi:hypothetical protein
MNDFEELEELKCSPSRLKSRRTRIKEHRAKRNRKRFYITLDNKTRARKTGVKKSN